MSDNQHGGPKPNNNQTTATSLTCPTNFLLNPVSEDNVSEFSEIIVGGSALELTEINHLDFGIFGRTFKHDVFIFEL